MLDIVQSSSPYNNEPPSWSNDTANVYRYLDRLSLLYAFLANCNTRTIGPNTTTSNKARKNNKKLVVSILLILDSKQYRFYLFPIINNHI